MHQDTITVQAIILGFSMWSPLFVDSVCIHLFPSLFFHYLFFLYLLDVLQNNERLQKEAGMLSRSRKYFPAPKNGCLLLILGVSGKFLREPHQRIFGKKNWFPNEVLGHLVCVLISYKYIYTPLHTLKHLLFLQIFSWCCSCVFLAPISFLWSIGSYEINDSWMCLVYSAENEVLLGLNSSGWSILEGGSGKAQALRVCGGRAGSARLLRLGKAAGLELS